MRIVFKVILLVLIGAATQAQNRKQDTYLRKADEAFGDGNYTAAQANYEKVYAADSTRPEINFRLGKIAALDRNETQAVRFYEKVINATSPQKEFADAYSYVAYRELRNGNYQRAKDLFAVATDLTPSSSMLYHNLKAKIADCDMAIDAQKNAYTITPVRLPTNINQRTKQYFPVLTADNQHFFFTAVEDDGNENIYEATVVDGVFTEAQKLKGKVNSENNEGTCTITADGRTMVFTSCNGRESLGSCDLYITYFENGEWSSPKNLGHNVNSEFWESQPALSSDGKLLFFSSERPGGKGGKDLWVSKLSPKNEWRKAVNLGGNINTERDDISPYFHANGTTLFFSSNGRKSLGGFDIFMAELKNDAFGTPENIGYPINDAQDQISLFITSDGSTAFYANDSKAAIDLYQFKLPSEIKNKFTKVNYLKGAVSDKKTQQPLTASIQVYDLKTQQLVSEVHSDANGEYLAVLPHGKSYALHISKEGYLFKSLNFDISSEEEATGKSLNIAIEPIEKEADVVLSNIFFDTGSTDLRSESYLELDKLTDLLLSNPTVNAEIKAHTDDVGNESDNMELSRKRAESVVNYLTGKGVPPERLRAKGLGETSPLIPNDSDEHRQLNRRIEFRII